MAGLSIRAITFTCRCSGGSFWLAWKAFSNRLPSIMQKSASGMASWRGSSSRQSTGTPRLWASWS